MVIVVRLSTLGYDATRQTLSRGTRVYKVLAGVTVTVVPLAAAGVLWKVSVPNGHALETDGNIACAVGLVAISETGTDMADTHLFMN